MTCSHKDLFFIKKTNIKINLAINYFRRELEYQTLSNDYGCRNKEEMKEMKSHGSTTYQVVAFEE